MSKTKEKLEKTVKKLSKIIKNSATQTSLTREEKESTQQKETQRHDTRM